MAEFFAERQGLLSKSEDAQTEYADQGGFCPLHTWQLAAFSSPRGISRGHETLIRRMAELWIDWQMLMPKELLILFP